MCRKATMAIDVTVVPSLLCENFQIIELPSDRCHCLLMFDAVNKTSNDMELSYSVQSGSDQSCEEVMNIQGNDKNRVTMNLPRVALPVSEDSKQQDSKDFKTRRGAECKRYVRDKVKLHWSLPACRASGTGNVDNLKLDAIMIQALMPDPITFDVKINGQEYDNTSPNEVTSSLCSIVDLSVLVSNKSDELLGPLLLTIEPYQDQASGFPVTELDGKLSWIGTLQLHTSELSPGSSLCHSCSLVFLYAGQYMVSISCTRISDEQADSKDSVSNVMERTRHLESNMANLENDSPYSSLKKTWTFSPPIKINVV